MRRPRIVRFADMFQYDHTRPIEFWYSGAATFAVGLWIEMFWFPPNPATGYWLWKWIGPTTQAWVMMAAGFIQMTGAGTKWVIARLVLAWLVMAIWIYTAVIYTKTAMVTLTTPLLWIVVIGQAWVAYRILYDKGVNGSDRRMRRQYHGDSSHGT